MRKESIDLARVPLICFTPGCARTITCAAVLSVSGAFGSSAMRATMVLGSCTNHRPRLEQGYDNVITLGTDCVPIESDTVQ